MPDAVSSPARRVTVIRNPGARRLPREADLQGALESLERSGWSVTVRDTSRAGDATVLAQRAADDGVDVVVACGGDGTLNEAANGVVGSETALALIPGGTANVWAHEVGIASDPAGALGLVTSGRRVRVDTGIVQIGDHTPRHFVLMCSAGMDAGAVQAVERRPGAKRRLGRAAFGWPGLRALFTKAVESAITVDGRLREAPLLMVLAGNTQLYGSIMRLTAEAQMDDGELDLVTFEDPPRGGLRLGGLGLAGRRTSLLVRALRGGLQTAQVDGLEYARVRRVEIRPTAPLPVQADGEYIGTAGPEAPLRLSVDPRSLTMLVPAGVHSLFSSNGAH